MLLSAGIAVIEVISVQTLIFVPGSCVPCRKYLNHFIILPLVLPTTIVFTIDFKYYYSLCFSVNFITHLISLSGMNVIAWYCLGTYWVNLFRYLLFFTHHRICDIIQYGIFIFILRWRKAGCRAIKYT